MQNRISKYPGRVRIVPEDGSAPFYATMERADEPTDPGTPLNKNTFLKDATAALLGLSEDAVPDDALVILKTLLDKKSALSYGNYVGTGEYATSSGSENATKIPVGFEPDFVFVAKTERALADVALSTTNPFQTEMIIWQRGVTQDRVLYGSASNAIYRHYLADEDGLAIWISGTGTKDAKYQLNEKDVTYHYIAGRGAIE